MGKRKVPLSIGEYYHVCNRGVDKRQITMDAIDSARFLQGLAEFNVQEPIGSIYENSFKQKASFGSRAPKSDDGGLVDVVAYCLNPNHYHLLLHQVADRGIERYMQKLGTSYTNYFNNRYERSGSLFQGRFKAEHIGTDASLLRVSAYINLNDKIHQLGSPASKLVRSSWREYIDKDYSRLSILKNAIVLSQFRSIEEYKYYAKDTAKSLMKNKLDRKDDEFLNF